MSAVGGKRSEIDLGLINPAFAKVRTQCVYQHCPLPDEQVAGLVQDGRLLVVARKNSDPVITKLPDAERPYRYNLRAGMVDGQWWAF